MEQLSFSTSQKSRSRVIASSGVFQIELLERVGEADYPQLIEISKSLVKEYGEKAILTKSTIQKYFNKSGSLPFIACYRNKIIGYIIGVPIEELSHESWAQLDENFGKGNKGNGYAKMLKRVFLSWAKKRKQTEHITGHVANGISARFTGDIKIVNRIDNWQGTGKSFEYYRRDLIAEKSSPLKNNPPLITRT